MADGLAVAAEGANILGSQPRLGQQGVGGGGKLAGHQVVGHPHAVDLVVARGAEGVQFVRSGPGVAEGRLDPQFIPLYQHQHGVDTIHAGTGHQADITLAHDCSLWVSGMVAQLPPLARLFWASCSSGLSSLASWGMAWALKLASARPLSVSACGRLRVRGFLCTPPTTNS